MNLSFKECYRILDISDNCDWLTIRKKYKTLIQQCHPDRLPENSPQLKEAEEAIRNYNAAYKKIADYYQANKALPSRLSLQDPSDTQTHTPRKKRPSVNHAHLRTKTRNKQRKPVKTLLSLGGFSILSLFMFGQYLYNPASVDKDQLKSNKQQPPTTKTINETKTLAIKEKEIISQPTRLFTTGSSLGEVILIQGEPTRIDQNIWYYGKSTVTFTNGVVSDWSRDPETPLNAKQTPSYQLRKADKENPKPSNKPYWNR